MNLTEVKSVPVDRKRRSRVGRGRGSGWGKTSRRGQKGAHSRTGWGGGIMREGGQMAIARRLPKKGFNNSGFRVNYEVVNVERLGDAAPGGEVTPDSLKAAGIIKKSARWVKVLGDGAVPGALRVAAHHFSRGARTKIEAAGGTVTVLPGRHGKQAPASPGERHAAVAAMLAAKPKPARKEPLPEPKGAEGEGGKKGRAEKAEKKKPEGGGEAKAPRPPKELKAPKEPKPKAPKGPAAG